MRFFEVEDRAVAWFDPNNAIVFTGGSWRRTSISLARKTLLDGTELTRDEFWHTFPVAAAQLETSQDLLP